MVIVERVCAGCGNRFRVERDQLDRFCSGICAGNPPVTTLLAEALHFVAHQARLR
jgi:hypothetical protein